MPLAVEYDMLHRLFEVSRHVDVGRNGGGDGGGRKRKRKRNLNQFRAEFMLHKKAS